MIKNPLSKIKETHVVPKTAITIISPSQPQVIEDPKFLAVEEPNIPIVTIDNDNNQNLQNSELVNGPQ